MSWECLPFSSKKNKNGKKNEKLKEKNNVNSTENKKNCLKKTQKRTFRKYERDKRFSSDIEENLKSSLYTELQNQHKNIIPIVYNSGFGFDLHGGILDNQLTFIDNVNPNGNAAKKGLKNGNLI